ncbi:MAG: rRNA methyltransferase [Bacteroidetes bacterium RIFCSPLOWO2_12_FULL_35_15]|nr:MAG: rRNA methyltransferase [Bacteroidetes bacterium RIFCSPLOWO2_12_FULL_35_15]
MNFNKELVNYLSQFVSETRRTKFDEVLNFRTRHITIVLEDLYQPHNASAVLRSCDIFGIQDIHIIENKNAYTVNKDIAMGAPKWLNLHKYRNSENNTLEAIKKLKAKGYKIVATSPNKNDVTIENLSVEKPLALFFGTELTGISETVLEHADEFVKIPMFGFTESFNISVSAALCIHALTSKLHKSEIDWHISSAEKEELLLTWLRKSIRKVELIEKDFFEKQKEMLS